MIAHFLHQQQLAILTFVCVLFLITLFNILTIKSLGSSTLSGFAPMVSILVPVRNEAQNIEGCLNSLLAQDYEPFEVIALDDESQDATAEILKRMSQDNSRLQVLSGLSLPSGWVGKNWACFQLSQVARGEFILFVDADTRHHPSMLTETISALNATQADLLSGLPRQEIKTIGERLILPILPWAILSFFPIRLFQLVPFSFASIAVGQFILCRRSEYLRVGGHSAVRSSVIEDMALVRLFKKNGLKWEFINLKDRVYCRMYHNFQQVLDGLSKNLFAVFGNILPVFLLIWLWLAIVFITPALSLVLFLLDTPFDGYSPSLGLAAVGFSLLLWLVSLWYFRMPIIQAAAYPLTIALAGLIAIRSAWFYYIHGSISWKGREVKTARH